VGQRQESNGTHNAEYIPIRHGGTSIDYLFITTLLASLDSPEANGV
jgi:hypothetical protein